MGGGASGNRTRTRPATCFARCSPRSFIALYHCEIRLVETPPRCHRPRRPASPLSGKGRTVLPVGSEAEKEIERFRDLIDGLPDVEQARSANYTSFSVHGKRFGYLWPRTRTVGLKQTLAEQIALVSERPDVFEVQFTAGGFGWVVVYLEKIDHDELAELVFEAWRLTASPDLVDTHPGPQALIGSTARSGGQP